MPHREPAPWRRALLEARRAALGALGDQDRRAAQDDIAAAAGRRRAEQSQKAARARRIGNLLIAGHTSPEIAAAVGVSLSRLRALRLKHGLPLADRRGFRRLFAWLRDEHVAALDRLAADAGTDRDKILDRLLKAALQDDAHVARRTLGIRKMEKERAT